VTILVALLSIAILAWGPPAQGSHIPATGPVPSNCVEFQSGTTGPKSPPSFPGVTINVTSWTNTPGDPHTVNFTISGLVAGQYVDISVKSGTFVQESGSYMNGAHSYSNGLQNGMSHIRLCVFVTTTTTQPPTTDPTTPTTDPTTPTTDPTTPTTAPTTPTTAPTTPTTDPTTPTTDPTTPTTAPTTPTTAPTTPTTDQVLGTTITAPTTTVADPGAIPDEVLGTTIVAGDLPFTGVEATTLGGIALSLLALGMLVLLGIRSFRGRSEVEEG
jgi:hypothetical protein